MAEIVFSAVTKVYPDGTRAVSSVDLTIPDGKLAVLVGPSGCGKTTLLRMVAGLEYVTEGTISIGERIVNNIPSKDRDIAMVFQNYALYPHMTVRDNIGFGLKLRGMAKPRIAERVHDAGGMLGLLDQLVKKPRDLSGGQRQRVAMGRAIVRAPQVFLMDEPLSNLDAKLRVQMRVEIARIQRELGVTMIYVTHDQTEAMTMGDIVAVMHDGVLQQVDSPQALFDRPHNLFVAGFMGSPPMNLAVASLKRVNGRLVADMGGHQLHLGDTALAARPRLAELIGRDVVIGIRPEDFEVASTLGSPPALCRMNVRVDIRETLGRETYLYFDVAAPPAAVEGVSDPEQEGTVSRAHPATTGFVARVSARAAASVGDEVELAVDSAHLHIFDNETGAAISDRTSNVGFEPVTQPASKPTT